MRKLIVCSVISLDGYLEGPGGNVLALPMDQFFDEHNLERLMAADALLVGAKTYTLFKGFWPPAADDPRAAMGEYWTPERADVTQAIGRRMNEIDKVVVSDSLDVDDTAPWTDTTTIVRRRDAHEAVAKLKEQPGEQIFMSGSRTLFNDLLAAGLVDELRFIVGAVVLGGGTPAFDTGLSHTLRLVTTRRHDGSDNVLLCYEVDPEDASRSTTPA